jgi:hypothetical protein
MKVNALLLSAKQKQEKKSTTFQQFYPQSSAPSSLLSPTKFRFKHWSIKDLVTQKHGKNMIVKKHLLPQQVTGSIEKDWFWKAKRLYSFQ